MYKDKDKQKEANRQAKSRQRRRDSRRQPKGMTSLGTTEGMTVADEPSSVIPEGVVEFDNVEALLDDLHDTKPKQVFPKTTKFPTHKPDIMRPLTDKDVAAMPLVTVVNRPHKPQSHNPMMVGYVPPPSS